MVTIHGNEYLLRTAFINLMENNCKFSHNHSSTVRISFPGNKVLIRFFGHGHRHLARRPGATVERIVKLHGGAVSVDSRQGEGTVFTLAFEHI